MLLSDAVFATPGAQGVPPTVQLDQGTFKGITDGLTSSFLGIPFAKAPYVGLFLSVTALEAYMRAGSEI